MALQFQIVLQILDSSLFSLQKFQEADKIYMYLIISKILAI